MHPKYKTAEERREAWLKTKKESYARWFCSVFVQFSSLRHWLNTFLVAESKNKQSPAHDGDVVKEQLR